jgi:starch synthase (maltosyl-transferring)
MTAKRTDGRGRVIVEGITPVVDGGRFPAKRTMGDQVRVEADIFTDGHDAVAASLLAHREGSEEWTEIPMRPLVNDRWAAAFRVAEIGRYGFKVQGWVDHFETWQRDLMKRITAESDTAVDYLIGADLVAEAAGRAAGDDAAWLRERAKTLRSAKPPEEMRTHAISPKLRDMVLRYPDKRFATVSEELSVVVDPVRARFSAWYEFFPRSTAEEPGRHGTFVDCEKRLEYIAGMGFNVVYLPPIHPIGLQFRKGRNNSTEAQPGDCGSPWAIGSAEGGHKAIHSELGTIEDFRHFVVRAEELGLSVALDIAFQVAPDHPYVREHESWFRKRPDGTIQYAENPPKKYQDIFPLDFESEDWAAMWEELKSVFLYWLDQGVTIFRVDNPHTKAFPFWEWVHWGDQARAPGGAVSCRGVHAAQGHVPAGQDWFQPVVYILSVAQRETRDRGLPDRADADTGARVLPAEPVDQYAGHPDRVSADWRESGVCDPAAAGGYAGRKLRGLRAGLRAA